MERHVIRNSTVMHQPDEFSPPDRRSSRELLIRNPLVIRKWDGKRDRSIPKTHSGPCKA